MRSLAFVAAGLLVACAHRPPLHMGTTAEDLARAGLGPVVVVAEDGRRTTPGTDAYEWWYLDGVADDGTVLVVWFGDNWLVGTHTRQVSIELTRPGAPTRRASYSTSDPGTFAAERADVHIGNHIFAGDLKHYRVEVDAAQTGGLGCRLTLEARVAPFRPGTGIVSSGDDFFAWLAAVPEGALHGEVSVDGQAFAFSGSGYHDHNWGNVPPWALMRGWWWGRGQVGDQTVVMTELWPAPGRGEATIPLSFIEAPSGVVLYRPSGTVRLLESSASPHGDEVYPKGPLPSGVALEPLDGLGPTVRFVRQGAPLASASLLGDSSLFVRMLARLAGRRPWYSRWAAEVRIEGPGGVPATGQGTLERMEFE